MFWMLMACIWVFTCAVAIGAFGWIVLPVLIIGTLACAVIIEDA